MTPEGKKLFDHWARIGVAQTLNKHNEEKWKSLAPGERMAWFEDMVKRHKRNWLRRLRYRRKKRDRQASGVPKADN